MAAPRRIQRRLAGAIVLTALIPLLAALVLAETMVRQTSERFFMPDIGRRLDEALGLYRELARAQKESMRYQAAALSADEALRRAAWSADATSVRKELARLFPSYPELVSLAVEDASGDVLAAIDRGHPVDEQKEFALSVDRPLGEGEESARLLAEFATNQEQFKGLERMSEFVDTYSKIVGRRDRDERSYVLAFGVLLGFTIMLAIAVGATLARGVSTRIAALADATKRVGAGDLGTRVDDTGSDEIAALAHAFNRMLVEVKESRARIEYLQRIGAWQEMARRLAHEIKNPLTPIQLATEEVHERYRGDDAEFRRLLDATLEVVRAEVGTLQRLVGEFSDFARLPQAHLEQGDLGAFLREQESQISLLEDGFTGATAGEPNPAVDIVFDLAEGPAPAYLDRHMLRRVFINLVRNAVQAMKSAGKVSGTVRVQLTREDDVVVIGIDDDGPGIPPDMRERVFDPYVTTRTEGTGLGLAIVKKILVDHGGGISAEESPLGGARFRLQFPVLGTALSKAALESRSSPPSDDSHSAAART